MFADQSGSLPYLSTTVAYLVGALGYLSMIAVVDSLLKSIGETTRTPRLIVLTVLAGGAFLQICLLALFVWNHSPAPGLNIISAAFFLAVPVSFAPLLQRIEDGEIKGIGKAAARPGDHRASPSWHRFIARNPILPASRNPPPRPNGTIRLSVIAQHSPTILAQISNAISEVNSIVCEMALLHRQHDILEFSIEAGIHDQPHQAKIITALRGTKGVLQVEPHRDE